MVTNGRKERKEEESKVRRSNEGRKKGMEEGKQ